MRFILAASLIAAALQLAAATSSSKEQTHFNRPAQDPAAATFDTEGRETYHGHQVWRLDVQSQQDSIKRQVMDILELLNLDLWHASPSHMDVRVPPAAAKTLKRLLSSHLTTHTEMISDLQSLVDASRPAVTRSLAGFNTSTLDTEFHDAYHSLEDLYAFGDQLVQDFPGLVEGFTVGYGAEGREIRGWKASKPASPLRAENKLKGGKRKGHKHRGEKTLEFVMQGGSHAREWVAPSAIMYFLHAMLLEAREDPDGDTAGLLEIFTFVAVPTINPDGFVYSMEKSRLWRKNRQDTGSRVCQGIDLNRNWGYKWTDRRSPTICSDSYPGASAFQSPETSAMANYLINGTDLVPQKSRKVEAFIDMHSYGQLFMFPFAHSCSDFPPDAETLMEAGLGVAKAMRGRHGQPYQAGQACDLTFRAPGDAIDYSYGEADVRWSYSSELRDTGTYGFMLPPHLIRPAAEEATAGLVWLASFIATLERL